jgi:membrane-bound metal-dependent hydrolase YbcI (DUF457 family)
MQGRTHLAFGTAIGLTAVGLAGAGLGAGVIWRQIQVPGSIPLGNSINHFGSAMPAGPALPQLQPAAWLAIALAAGLGAILPDIDQPGSLVTRLPGKQAQALQQAARPISRGVVGAPVGLATSGVVAGADLAGTILGARPGGPGRALRSLLYVLAILCLALAAIARWLPPSPVLTWPVQTRHAVALACLAAAALAVVMALGGVAGVVHRLPGHHRGWTHAPPVAIVVTVLASAFGPALFPALPGVGPAFAAGYISHLASDALTIRGIPLWWPGSHQPSLHLLPRALRVRTGGPREGVFNAIWPLALAAVWLA